MAERSQLLVAGVEPHLPHAVLRLLREAGYDVLKAADGAQALCLARERRPALVVLDVTLTDPDGLDVCRQIKADPALAGTFVLLCSDVRTSSAQQAEGLEGLADGYIAWPMPEREFLARVDSLVRLGRAQQRTAYLNRVLRAVRNVNQLIVREHDPQRLIEGACERLVETRGYLAGWIATLDAAREVTGVASSGLGAAFAPVAAAMQHGEWPLCARAALEQAGVVVIQGPLAACGECPIAAHLGATHVLAVRIEHDGVIYGLLNLYLPLVAPLDAEDLALATEVAGDLGLALRALELEADRRRAEQALRASEERFRRLAENALDIVYRYEFTPRRGFTYVSPAATAITGYTPEDHYADPDLVLKLVHPEDRPLLERYFQGQGHFSQPITLRWVRKDGRVIWTEQLNVPVLDQEGHLVALEGIARDITERKQAEALARYHAHILANVNDAVVASDERFVITAWNRAAERTFGWKAEEALGQPAPLLFQTEFIGVTREKVLRQQDEAGQWEGEVIEHCKDGRRIYTEERWSVVTDEGGPAHRLRQRQPRHHRAQAN